MRAAVVVAIVLAPALAAADPSPRATTTAELGAGPVAVTLSDTGELTIGSDHVALAHDGPLIGGTIQAMVAPPAPGAAPVPMVAVTFGDRSHPELAVVLAHDRGAWREVVRVPTGAVGADADYRLAIALTRDGIVRFQQRAGLIRCDGKTPWLYPEGWTGSAFRPIVPPDEVDPVAAVLAVSPDHGPVGAAPLLFHARWASAEADAGNAGELGIPRALDDGNPATAWRHRDGRGQFFTFVPRVPGAAAQLRIVPGQIAGTRRLTRFAVVADHAAWWVDVPRAGGAFVVDLPAPVDGCVTVVIARAGARPTEPLAIPELEVFAPGEREHGGEALLASAIARDTAGATDAAIALSQRGAPAVTAIADALAQQTDPRSRARLVHALTLITDPAAAPVLARAVTERWVTGPDLGAALDALGARGDAATLRAVAASAAVEVDVRIAAASAIAATTPAGFAALLDLAGRGGRAERKAVIAQLASGSPEALVHAATAATAAPAAGDLWRALTRRARVAGTPPADRAAAIAAMVAALPAATDYERRYRLIEGISTLGDAPALATVTSALHGLGAGPEDAALRELAARAIGSAPRAAAMPLLLALARDPGPGVRLAALAALAQAPDAAAGDGDIDQLEIAALAGDAWPEVRRRAATALGARCRRPADAAALVNALGHDAALLVKTDALDALVACRADGIAARLIALWGDGKAPTELRAHAIDVAAELADPALGAALVAKLPAWRGAALDHAEALELAQHAAVAVGRLAPPGAAAALTDALGDAAYPEIIAAAADGLAALGAACPAAARAKLADLARSDDRTISVAAAHAAELCGRK